MTKRKKMTSKKPLEDRLAEAATEAEAGEADQTTRPIPSHVKVGQPGRTRSKVLQVRLNPEEMAALEVIAERRELPVSTVAREQILRLLVTADDEREPLVQLLDAATQIGDIADEVRRSREPTAVQIMCLPE
ncbi:hypothetical protein MSS2_04720 [Mycobacterium marinum]|uniref:hypothetical protein n=1 Tax=Mycobacterium marinum TaxID=1781 RepID=UPI000ED27E5F|nr:hypothetical protein [Mycobacterium marinum]RFZ48553.1 hypothetical protein MSS2_04720 [Mycobacterium marinum]